MWKLILILTSLSILQSCITQKKCYERYPPYVIDSSFVLDTVVKIKMDTVNTYIHLDPTNTDSLAAIYEDSLMIIKGRWAKEVHSITPTYQIQTIYKDRMVKIKVADTLKFIKEIVELKRESEARKEHLDKCQEKCGNDMWKHIAITAIVFLLITIVLLIIRR